MLPTTEIKAISSLIPIYLHLKKLYGRFLLRGSSLSPNHIIKSILSSNSLCKHLPHNISIDNLTPKQRIYLISPLIDMDNRCNKIYLVFLVFDEEFNSGN